MPLTCPPNEVSVLQLQVADMREESREEDDGDKADVWVYSDRSGIEGMAGVAAVLFHDRQEIRSLRYQLGPLTHHTTYEAEVVGVLLAAELIHKECAVHTATIRLDSQAVMQALDGCSTKLAQSLLNSVHEACNELLTNRRRRDRQLTISWVSGHDRVKGNEHADNKAKIAAREGSSPEDELPEALQGSALLSSLSALGGAFKEMLWARWKSLWAKSPQKGQMDKVDNKLPSHSFLLVTGHLSRAQASMLMQLRTGHVPLNYFLHKINKAESLVCPACQLADETVHHYLFDCLGFVYERHTLARTTGCNSKSIRHLLGNWHAFKAVLAYIHATGRFRGIYGDLHM